MEDLQEVFCQPPCTLIKTPYTNLSYKLPKELYIILDKRNWVPAFAGMTKGISAINK